MPFDIDDDARRSLMRRAAALDRLAAASEQLGNWTDAEPLRREAEQLRAFAMLHAPCVEHPTEP